jgi:hypothetical protein
MQDAKNERENMGNFITMNLVNSYNPVGIPSIIATAI